MAKYAVVGALALAWLSMGCDGNKASRDSLDAALDQRDDVSTSPIDGPGTNSDAPLPPPTCQACHGNSLNAAPPTDPSGNSLTTAPGVGAHQAHLGASTWHAEIHCTECHIVPTAAKYDPTVPTHLNGKDDLTWGALAGMAAFDSTTLTCAGVYCHGVTLSDAAANGGVKRTPVWNQVDGTWSACGTTCHTNPPGGTHPASAACETCHSSVVTSFTAGNPPTVAWKDPSLHINGKIDLTGGTTLTCTSCHGDPSVGPSPPKGTKGETLTTQAAVGAHAQHLAASTWHRNGQCADCHVTPSSTSHANGQVDFTWGAPSDADGVTPAFNATDLTCNAYCHGVTLPDALAGGSVKRAPVWNQVDGTWDACGTTCHTNPPGGSHVPSTACETCHSAVVASFAAGDPPTVTWKDPSLHINGKVDLASGTGLTCTSCHGDPDVGPAPPKGTKGETSTTQSAVGAHAQHLAASPWHRAGQCSDCHKTPTTASHSNGQVDFTWGAPSDADGVIPAFNATDLTCNAYCHGVTLPDALAGGSVKRTPVWNQVDGTWDACGTTCHTNPPGGGHPSATNCETCHSPVIASFATGDPPTVTWKDPSLHINGKIDLAGGSVLTCTSCHGDPAAGPAPPKGVDGETATNTLAVGRHGAHLTASTTHTAIPCETCHVVPVVGDTTHMSEHVASASLDSAGHHGDLAFSGSAAGMTWNVNATQGAPVTARGTCTGACHGNGRGGAPAVTPYWAGGSWNAGSCSSCHASVPRSGEHERHAEEGPCSMCHPGADAATHVNGVRDLLATGTGPQGGSVTMTKPPNGSCSDRVSCTGSCHDETHNTRCW